MVQKGRRHATIDVSNVSEAALSRLRSERTSRSSACRATPCTRLPAARANSFDNLTGVAAQCRDPRRRVGVSRDNGPMACRASRPSPQVSEACGQCGIADLCGGTAGGQRHRIEWRSCSRAGGFLEGPSAWTAEGAAMGERLEPGADRPPPAGRLPGR